MIIGLFVDISVTRLYNIPYEIGMALYYSCFIQMFILLFLYNLCKDSTLYAYQLHAKQSFSIFNSTNVCIKKKPQNYGKQLLPYASLRNSKLSETNFSRIGTFGKNKNLANFENTYQKFSMCWVKLSRQEFETKIEKLQHSR